MKTIKHTLLTLMVFFVANLNAQEATVKSRVDEMHSKKWQYMVERAKLTPAEADLVLPVFMEYEKAIWSQHQKTKSFYKSIKTNNENNPINYAELNDRYAEMDLIQGRLFKAYHTKLQKILQPEILFKYYHAEREFKRKLLQDMQGHLHRKK